jgi:hypothetical protein
MTKSKSLTPCSFHALQIDLRTGLLDIILAWRLVLGDEELGSISGYVVGELRQFLSDAVYRWLVHIGLRKELW